MHGLAPIRHQANIWANDDPVRSTMPSGVTRPQLREREWTGGASAIMGDWWPPVFPMEFNILLDIKNFHWATWCYHIQQLNYKPWAISVQSIISFWWCLSVPTARRCFTAVRFVARRTATIVATSGHTGSSHVQSHHVARWKLILL